MLLIDFLKDGCWEWFCLISSVLTMAHKCESFLLLMFVDDRLWKVYSGIPLEGNSGMGYHVERRE